MADPTLKIPDYEYVEDDNYGEDEDIIILSDIEEILESKEYSFTDDLWFPSQHIHMIKSETGPSKHSEPDIWIV